MDFLGACYGKRPLELLDAIGFLGPRTLVPYITTLGDGGAADDGEGDLERLSESSTIVVHCSLVSIWHGGILRSFDRFRCLGINLALGTDTFPPDMIRVMAYGSNHGKYAKGTRRRAALPISSARLPWVARSLGRDDLGRLAPGAKADITVEDLSPLKSVPIDDPIRTMLYNTNGSRCGR